MLNDTHNIGSGKNCSQVIDEVLKAAEGVTQITEEIIQKTNSIFQAELMAAKTDQVNMDE